MAPVGKTSAPGAPPLGSRGAGVAAGAVGVRAVPALKARVRELEELFEEASIGLVWTTRAGRVLQVNRALLEVLECRREDCVGHPWAENSIGSRGVGRFDRRVAHRETLRNHATALRARGAG
jgi:PAS domain-containing protein